MFAIYKRELKSCLQSFIGFLFMGVILFFVGLYFTLYSLLNGYPYFAMVVSAISFIILIAVPILTMRTLAEEKRSRTDQLILTAPVSVGSIVAGKYLALLTIFAIPMVIVGFYPIILSFFGAVPMAECYIALLGFFLYGGICIAVGVFISSLTESQVIAAVLSFGALFLGYMMSALCSMISSTGNLFTRILSCLDLFTPFENLLGGTLEIKSLFYYVSGTLLLLFLTVQSIQKRRYSVSAKHFSMGAYSTGMIGVAIAIVVVANMLLGQLPGTFTSIDLTDNKLYSLTERTKDFLQTVEEDVNIYVIVNQDNCDTTLDQTLNRYRDLNKHITLTYVDPQVNPRFHTQYTSGNISMNSVIVESSKRSIVVDYNDMYESEFDYTTYTSNTTGYDGEGQITSAIHYVISDELAKAYILEGHGEYELSSGFLEALSKENVEYETLNLLQKEEVPEDAACVIINGLTKDFSPDDVNKLTAYLDKGGKILLVSSILEEEAPNLNKLVNYMGLTLAPGLVFERDADYYYQNPYYLLPKVGYDDCTDGIYNKFYIFAPYCQGIEVPAEEKEGFTYSQFLTTSENAFAKAALDTLDDTTKLDEDTDGPFAIGIRAQKTLSEGTATMVVYGCDQIFTDSASNVVSGANRTLFVNTVSGFADHDITISIPVKSYQVSYITIPHSTAVLIGLVVTVILPLAGVVCGFVIWFRRRRR